MDCFNAVGIDVMVASRSLPGFGYLLARKSVHVALLNGSNAELRQSAGVSSST